MPKNGSPALLNPNNYIIYNANAHRIYYRFLETADEYFYPAGGHHLQGRWMIYGLQLPDEVLEKIYNKNAQKILSAAVRQTK